ncbi:WD repeat-containing protein 76 isoform X2 [Plectropomus leopardus]|uniref:WD repeat-containing protein 76 isoform X2 n=1 Tax=Plectropomus leopardus TaxID=160734 RepID=UPI001C4D22DB|nr:WD repeat-containing protein 76 isoform X2 [Plectropomus leopardus]
MEGKRAKPEAVVQEMTPVHLEGPVRRSSRNALAPKRLQYSPEAEIASKKRRTTTHNGPHSQTNTKEIKKEIKKEDVENSDVERISRTTKHNDKNSQKNREVKKEEEDVESSDVERSSRTTMNRNSKKSRKDIKKKKEEDEDVENSDVQCTSDEYGGLSSYELERLENIRQNQAFLSSINLLQATTELKQLARPKPSQRGLMRSQAAVKEVLPPRKSLRLQNKEAEVLTLPPEPRGNLIYDEPIQKLKKPPGPLHMDPLNMEEGSKLPSQLLELCSEDSTEERKTALDLKDYRSALKNMKITDDRVAKVVKDRIFSAAFHPCSSSLLMATGDKWGKVGLWKLGSDWGDDGVLLFEPHCRPVSCMAFSRAHPTHLLSLSYDGSLRCMDVEKAVFDDVYDIEDGLKTFDFMSHDCSTLVVGNWWGEVAIVDRRTPGNSHESLHSLDPKTLRCVSVHPVQKQYFAVAESKVVNIYDSRCLQKTKSPVVSQLNGHSLSITSAYFSPRTGNRVLTSCMDNHIRVYDTSAMTTKSPLLTSIRHDMHTGRWLSKLSAVWDPKQEDCFVVGCMERPRKVQVFHESGQRQHSFIDGENLNTVLSVTAFHPTRNALLGGNASGRLHVFSD